MGITTVEETCNRLEERDNRIMSMSIAQIMETYQHDQKQLAQILELREQIVRARAEGIA